MTEIAGKVNCQRTSPPRIKLWTSMSTRTVNCRQPHSLIWAS